MYTPQQSADIIVNLLNQKNISVEKMLKECDLKPRIINNMKAGSVPAADKFAKIAKYLGVTVEMLIGIDSQQGFQDKKNNSESKTDPELANDVVVLADIISDLDNQDIKYLIKFAKSLKHEPRE